MRKIRVWTVAVVVAALAGCSKSDSGGSGGGGGGSSGVEGAWHVDLQPMIDAQRPAMMQMLKSQMGPIEQLKSLPPEQREEALKIAEEQVPEEFRDLMKAMLAGEDEAVKAIDKMIKEKMKDAKGTITLKSDNTWTGEFKGMGDDETVGGTWSKSGSDVTFVTTTKNGQPASGDDAKTFTFAHKGDKLEGTIDGHPVLLKR